MSLEKVLVDAYRVVRNWFPPFCSDLWRCFVFSGTISSHNFENTVSVSCFVPQLVESGCLWLLIAEIFILRMFIKCVIRKQIDSLWSFDLFG